MKIQLKFSHKIFIAVIVIEILALSGFALTSLKKQSDTIYSSLVDSLSEVGGTTASGISYMLGERVSLVESVAQLLSDNTGQPFIDSMLEKKVYAEHLDLIYFGDEQGNYTKRPNLPIPAGYDARKRPWYIAAVNAQTTILTDPFVSASTGDLGITIAAPVQRNGALAGVAAGDLGLTTLTTMINSINLGGKGEAFLVNGTGQVLVSKDKARVMKTLAEIAPGLIVRPGKVLQNVEFGGRNQLINFTQISGLPSVDWYLGLAVDKDTAFAAYYSARQFAVVALLVVVLATALILSYLINILLKPLRSLGQALDDIAAGDGDLTHRLSVTSRDEFGLLADGFNRFVERIHSSIKEVAASAYRLNTATADVTSASNASIEGSDEQAQRTNSVAAAINELEAAAHEIARNAADASHQASEAMSGSEQSRIGMASAIDSIAELSKKIGISSERIQELNSRTASIGQILEAIQGISQQTNLLALNAAIEAARAGEAGRGFAVVADEVRSLAHRTQTSAQEIQGMITDLQTGSQDAVDFMTESRESSDLGVVIVNAAGDRLGEVTRRVEDISAVNHSVAAATEEQTAVVSSINIDIVEINRLNGQNVSNLQSTLEACRVLNSESKQLEVLVSRFRI